MRKLSREGTAVLYIFFGNAQLRAFTGSFDHSTSSALSEDMAGLA